MTAVASRLGKRRWLVPEVVQTSAMDCGPATLKCLLEGFHIPVSYGRLREACQTDVDGTSVDTIEDIANQLGVPVEQTVIPVEHLFLASANSLPAIVVVHHREGATHFVVVWRRHGQWLQVMDPSIGRRWIRCNAFAGEMYRHTLAVPAREWREWAASGDNLEPLRERLRATGAGAQDADGIIRKALADPGWFAIAALDAATRMTAALVRAQGVKAGTQAFKLLDALFERTCKSTANSLALIPAQYWPATPEAASTEAPGEKLLLHGAVVLRVTAAPNAAAQATDAAAAPPRTPLSPELAAALREKTLHPLRTVWQLLKEDGLLAPLALIGAMILAAGAVLVETLLFRGLFDMTWMLTQPGQRLTAVAALLAFALVLLLIQVPIFTETARMGRHLETRLRMALLRKLPHLSDRYFHSRPVSDMAERSHILHMTRQVPAIGLHLVQVVWELLLTLVGILLIDPASAPLALAIAICAVVLSLAAQPLLNERDLRVHNHAGALYGFYLDAQLGLTPVRTHGAEQAVSRQHEGLLVEWARASRGYLRMAMVAGGVQSLVCLGLAAALLVAHFVRLGGVTGADLLLVYWVLKMPAIGGAISSLANQYPGQRNILMRLLEPLTAPETHDVAAAHVGATAAPLILADRGESRPREKHAGAAGFVIDDGRVLAAGHTILRELNLAVKPGEHVAVVGKSGAGKSTLLGLLLGWHRLAGGKLTVDGKVLTLRDVEALRREIAWVDPAIQIWNSPFADNLVYASEDGGHARMGGVIDAANLRDVLQKLPQGLQTHLGESGSLLSGGEGQRVRLARALLQSDVRLALLDEPFRGMDRAQRSGLLADARRWWQHTTLLCVTHDVSETLNFNRVLVIEDGRVVEDGVPGDLAGAPSRYRDMLQTETLVREQMWRGRQWRRLRMQDGRVVAS